MTLGLPELGILFALVAIFGLSFWYWTLKDVISVPSDQAFRTGNKPIWVAVICLTAWIGCLLYVGIGRPRPRS
ncbi:MAG TPA: hypothetical protein VHF25_07990 [Nitriliruptorales bacterium]|nr:hypothetical protein [Nitriliruptorales bacterium]